MINKIRVKLWRIENVVLMKVLEMPEELRGNHLIFTSPTTSMEIRSVDEPELTLKDIYINGSNKDEDNKIVCCEYKSDEMALDCYNRIIKTIEEFNNKNKNYDIDIDTYVTD